MNHVNPSRREVVKHSVLGAASLAGPLLLSSPGHTADVPTRKQGKLCHVHFRNVRGTLPARRGYTEVFVVDGDLDMARVLRALDDVGYDGVIDYDHPVGIVGDEPLPKQYIAFAVGYMKGLIHSLPR